MVEVTKGFWATARGVGCCVVLAAAAAGAMAQDEPPPCPPGEEAALRSYVPTAAKLKAYTDAVTALQAALAKDPALAAQAEKTKEDPSLSCRLGPVTQGSFAGAQKMFTQIPQMGAIFGKEGITPRELAIWSQLAPVLALAAGPDPAAAAKDPTPPAIQAAMRAGANEALAPAQQAFARDNGGAIRRLAQVMQAADKRGQR